MMRMIRMKKEKEEDQEKGIRENRGRWRRKSCL